VLAQTLTSVGAVWIRRFDAGIRRSQLGLHSPSSAFSKNLKFPGFWASSILETQMAVEVWKIRSKYSVISSGQNDPQYSVIQAGFNERLPKIFSVG
jgi:hypothetical protein